MMIKEVFIRKAFEGDDEIFSLYDPLRPDVNTLEKLVDDVSQKIIGYEQELNCDFVGFENGFFCYSTNPSMLISFGINKNHRTPLETNHFWHTIKDKIGKPFICCLWTNNVRGIKWLQKQGMKEVEKVNNDLITVLKFN